MTKYVSRDRRNRNTSKNLRGNIFLIQHLSRPKRIRDRGTKTGLKGRVTQDIEWNHLARSGEYGIETLRSIKLRTSVDKLIKYEVHKW